MRIGMNKNLRVGRVKFVSPRLGGAAPNVLIDIHEECIDNFGKPYVSHYNLYILVKDSDKFKVGRDDVGRFCEVGFYLQSFRKKDMQATYDNVLELKSLVWLKNETEAKERALLISKSILTINN
jgi:hypothetical protein